MIRLIVECHEADFNAGFDRKNYITLDVKLPELERLLTKGGKGEMGFESWRLLGAEVFPSGDDTARQEEKQPSED
ncbi:MAG: hypothetical protein ACYDHZ_10780 [Dehalococcoidia bacterium]